MDDNDVIFRQQPALPSNESERLPIVPALKFLAPQTNWYLEGDNLTGLKWLDDPAKRPSDEAILTKARELKAQIPLTRLRAERNRRMRDIDWVTLRSVRTGEPIPPEWKEYMDALADLPSKYPNVQLVDNSLVGVEWPKRPDGIPAGPDEWKWFRG